MAFWSKEQCEDYVRAQASRTERGELLHPGSETFDDRYENILVGFDSMPDWMHYAEIINLDPTNFKFLRLAYQRERSAYRLRVTSRLSQIRARRTGLALIAEIADTEWTVRIVPYHGKGINAKTEADGDDRDATARGKPVYYRVPVARRSLRPQLGRGVGTDALITFSPEMWTGAAMAKPSNAPDEALFHEMVHASRIMRGVSDDPPVNAGYTDQEEYLAVVLTNIYMSEKGQWVFAGDHDISTVLQGSQATDFLRNPQKVDMPPAKLIENFRWSQPKFYQALVHLPAPPKYNWVRDYYQQSKGNFTM